MLLKNDVAYHALTNEEILFSLNTRRNGLSEEESQNRIKIYGENKLEEVKRSSIALLFLSQFKSVLIVILIVAALISGFILNEKLDMYVILVIVVMNAVIGFIQEYRAEKAVEALKKMVSPEAIVVRDSKERRIKAELVVPGDIVRISEGDRIPADGRLLQAINLRIDEAPLTGESTSVQKNTETLEVNTPISERSNMVFTGTHVTYGRGVVVITATGMETEFGKIAGMISTIDETPPPLKRKTEKLGQILGITALAGCILVFLIDYLSGIPLTESFLTSISLAVSAIPEGLPAVLVITLSLGARRMAQQNAIMRKLASVETLGTTTIICSDKTGTITKNEMTVKKIYVDNQYIEVTGAGYHPSGKFLRDGEEIKISEHEGLNLLLKIGLLCNNSRLEFEEELGHYLIGDPTEGALLVAAVKAGFNPEEVEEQHSRLSEIPFDSTRKRMSTIHETPKGMKVVYVKGAPEVILSLSTRLYTDGVEEDLTDDLREIILAQTREMGAQALRVLAVAYKDIENFSENVSQDDIERELVFTGLIGMMDPPRDEVREAIDLCMRAGIRPVMITGDHALTALSIAREVGIVRDDDSGSLSGHELQSMSDDELEKAVGQISVFSRVSPEHKVRVAQAFKRRGEIVAMTGDGVNDAPAIKAADIGVAMGIKGTDVTKEAADMVLGDDNFATIVKAVEGGRIIYDNIRKFMRYLISSNFDEMLVISSFVMIGLPIPLTPVMILWLNLVTDGGPAVALSMDVPTDDLMSLPPRDPAEGILHGLRLFILAYVAIQSGTIAATFVWKYVIQGSPLEVARTAAFMQACIFELVVVWNCRSERHNAFKVGFLTNRYLLLSVIAGLVLTISLCYVPMLQKMFNTTPLGLYDWIWISLSSLLGLLVLPEVFIKR